MNDYIKKQHWKILTIIFMVSILCAGIFFEYYSCAFSMSSCILLFFVIKHEKQFVWRWNLVSMSVALMIGMYLISALWAVDSGMAIIGFLKFLPVLLFLMLLMQKKHSAEQILFALPYFATILVVLAVGAASIPILKSKFWVAGRLAGFFQYPNTFALLLLIAELLLIAKSKIKMLDYIPLSILIAGLLMTGSRTVYVLAILANVGLILLHKNKKIRIVGICALFIVVVSIVIYVVVFDGTGVLARFMRFSVTESTFVGRFLYFVDAIPLILKHPFGLGYMGYYYIQQSVQTGLYSVMFIHNDWLQLMLDIGWIPCILLVTVIMKTMFRKTVSLEKKVIVMTVFLHSCFDFNLQFVAMFLLLILFFDYESGKEILIKKQLFGLKSGIAVIACLNLYCGVFLWMAHSGNYEMSLQMYPWNTQAQIQLLIEIDDLEESEKIAEDIIRRNGYVTLAYSVKARCAYSRGNFGELIKYKDILLEKAPYQYEEYEEYAYMLINGISLYTKAGDLQSAEVCRDKLLSLPEKLEWAEKRLSKLGKMIKDQPTTKLPKDICTYIDRLEIAK